LIRITGIAPPQRPVIYKKKTSALKGRPPAPACGGMMRNESLVQEIVALVALVRTKQALLQQGELQGEAELAEVFEDIVCHCDTLISSALSSPLTGRMHLDPVTNITPEECEEFLAEALGFSTGPEGAQDVGGEPGLHDADV